MALGTNNLRLKLTQPSVSQTPVALSAWRGNATDIDVAIYDDAGVAEISDVQSITLRVKADRLIETSLIEQVVSAFDATLDDATWLDGTKQHLTYELSNEDMMRDLSGTTSNTFWIVFLAILTDGSELTLGAGNLTIHEDNSEASPLTPSTASTAISLEQADARYINVGEGGSGGDGDMETSTYDPTGVAGDAFDMDQMTEGVSKILTTAERAIIASTSGTNTGDQDLSAYASLTVSDNAPATPSGGDLWLDSTQAKLYVYYSDIDSSQWVSVNSGSLAQSSKHGWMDYNNSTGAVTLLADTWTDVPNNGAGSFTNKAYKPANVTEVLDSSTGYLDFSDLPLGSEISLRNDLTITPNTNNALFEMRYVLGSGAGEYVLNVLSERLDSGSGIAYQRVSTFPIYMGDNNTKDNAGKLQVRLSTTGTLTNSGVYASIQLF